MSETLIPEASGAPPKQPSQVKTPEVQEALIPFDQILTDIKAAGKFPNSKRSQLKSFLRAAYIQLQEAIARGAKPQEIKKNFDYWRGKIADEALSGLAKDKKEVHLKALEPYLRRSQISDADLLSQYDVPLPLPKSVPAPASVSEESSRAPGQWGKKIGQYTEWQPSGREWQTVPEGTIQPPGLEFSVNLTTGLRQARQPEVAAPSVANSKKLGDNKRTMPNEAPLPAGNPAEKIPPVTKTTTLDAAAGAGGKAPSRLEKARNRRKERAQQAEEDGEPATTVESPAAAPLTPEDADDNPEFTKFLLAHFPDGNIPNQSEEVHAAQVEAFNAHQETVLLVADFYAELMVADGIVKVDKATREEFKSSINAYLLENVRTQPDLAKDLINNLTHYREAPARIAEKEKVLADLAQYEKIPEGHNLRDVLGARRVSFLQGKEHKAKLEADYGNGPKRSFFRGFLAGYNKKTQESGFNISSVGENGELKMEPAVIERRPGFLGRIAQGWRGGVEAEEKSEEAQKQMGFGHFKKLDEALKAGVLDDLEEKIKTLDDAEREKKVATEAFDQAREMIFLGVGELSGVVGSMRKKASATLEKMLNGEGDIASLQGSFDRLSKARERIANDNVSYLDANSINQVAEDVDVLIELEFEEQIQKALSKDLAKEKPYNTLRRMIGKFAGLERVGSRANGEVRKFVQDTIQDYIKQNKSMRPEKRLVLKRLFASLRDSEEAGDSGALNKKTSKETPDSEAPVEKNEKKRPEIPEKDDIVTLRFKRGGDKDYSYFDHFRVVKFKFKGDKPKPEDKMTITGAYKAKDGDKKRTPLTVNITYEQYRAWNLDREREKHA